MPEFRFQHLDCLLSEDVLILTVTTAELCGDDATDAVRQEMVRAACDSHAKQAVVDLKNVTYMASPGIRALLGFRRQFLDQGGRIVVCGLNQLIQDVLNTARLIGATGSSPPALFETARDVAAAIAFLRTAKPN